MSHNVNPVSVLRPSSEITTSARVKVLKAKKHIQKLGDEELDFYVKMALLATEKLENEVKARLKSEVSQCAKK